MNVENGKIRIINPDGDSDGVGGTFYKPETVNSDGVVLSGSVTWASRTAGGYNATCTAETGSGQGWKFSATTPTAVGLPPNTGAAANSDGTIKTPITLG